MPSQPRPSLQIWATRQPTISSTSPDRHSTAFPTAFPTALRTSRNAALLRGEKQREG